MKIKQKLNKFCKKCQTHELHVIGKYKPAKASKLSWITRQKERRHTMGNRGKYSKAPAKRYKNAKRLQLLLKCIKCTSKRFMTLPRMVKSEIIR